MSLSLALFSLTDIPLIFLLRPFRNHLTFQILHTAMRENQTDPHSGYYDMGLGIPKSRKKNQRNVSERKIGAIEKDRTEGHV